MDLPPGWYRKTRYSIANPPHQVSRANVGDETPRYTAWRINPKTDTTKYHPPPTLLGTRKSLAEAVALCHE